MIEDAVIKSHINKTVKVVNLPRLGKRKSGKVRDWFSKNGLRILVATDRISAFDRVLGYVPFRGAVLTKLSDFWFTKTRDIILNHEIGVIDPNIMLVSEASALPIEIIVRGYITGVTDTSLWKQYNQGKRTIYGIKFPDGLIKNQRLKKPIITPTTRATGKGGHDEPITKEEIIKQKIVSPALWKQIENVSLKLYSRGAEIAEKAGFILADTKYEFGLDKRGKLMLIDEIHTPDSSRFWVKKTYAQRFKKGMEVENFDKEFMRLWFSEQGFTGKGKIPVMPQDLIVKISQRYIEVYEKLTGVKLQLDLTEEPQKRILDALSKLI